MKVFISHHIGKDEKLASILIFSLKKVGIKGYIAQRNQEYELLIRDKIKEEIDSSDYLVAIITKVGLLSASLHEEIGYAIASGIPAILMVDEKIKEVKGVLIHGKEEEYFTRQFFEQHADIIAKYIQKKGIPQRKNRISKNRDIIKDEYQRYSPLKKIEYLKKDTISSFSEFKFHIHKIKITRREKRSKKIYEIESLIAENFGLKQRYYLIFDQHNLDKYDLRDMSNTISNWYFPSMRETKSMINIVISLSTGISNKATIERYYNTRSGYGRTAQNTAISVSPLITYYGLGEFNKLPSKGKEKWEFDTSIPKFFLSKVKSKDDIIMRLGTIFNFIETHKGIFKNVPKIKSLAEKYFHEDEYNSKPIIKVKGLR